MSSRTHRSSFDSIFKSVFLRPLLRTCSQLQIDSLWLKSFFQKSWRRSFGRQRSRHGGLIELHQSYRINHISPSKGIQNSSLQLEQTTLGTALSLSLSLPILSSLLIPDFGDGRLESTLGIIYKRGWKREGTSPAMKSIQDRLQPFTRSLKLLNEQERNASSPAV